MATQGEPADEVFAAMGEMRARDVDWRAGRAAVYVFHAGDDVLDVAHRAYGMFISENALGPAAFPSLKRMEAEVVEMGLDLLGAPEGAAGCMTSGGTESILLAMKACRDRAIDEGRVRGVPEVVVAATAHPAFNKGAHLLGMRVKRVGTRALLADPAAMAEHITTDTVMLVGSAPCFPYGLVDPIEELGRLARERALWLHVDACVGGYLAPFVRATGVDLPAFDFSVPGVTSMSADLHKYGYAAKGASTVFYRDRSGLDAQVFEFGDWPCGRMTTPTFAGTRPGGAVAAAWAVMRYLGVEGYIVRAARINAVRERIRSGVAALGMTVFGEPRLSIVAFGGGDRDVLAAGERLYAEGWFSSRVRDPDGIQFMISPEHDRTIDAWLAALATAIGSAPRAGTRRSRDDIRYS
jgi:glutamate/tyrosine decarboxylase-like PLP-dependent enzyme